jgi:excisionase family DNA binding protein
MNEVTLAGRLLVTPAEAADALGIGRTRVYELMAAGTLRSVKIGRSRRIPVQALIEFVSAMAEEGAA